MVDCGEILRRCVDGGEECSGIEAEKPCYIAYMGRDDPVARIHVFPPWVPPPCPYCGNTMLFMGTIYHCYLYACPVCDTRYLYCPSIVGARPE